MMEQLGICDNYILEDEVVNIIYIFLMENADLPRFHRNENVVCIDALMHQKALYLLKMKALNIIYIFETMNISISYMKANSAEEISFVENRR